MKEFMRQKQWIEWETACLWDGRLYSLWLAFILNTLMTWLSLTDAIGLLRIETWLYWGKSGETPFSITDWILVESLVRFEVSDQHSARTLMALTIKLFCWIVFFWPNEGMIVQVRLQFPPPSPRLSLESRIRNYYVSTLKLLYIWSTPRIVTYNRS